MKQAGLQPFGIGIIGLITEYRPLMPDAQNEH